MMHPSLTLLSLSIPEAMKTLACFNSFDDLPGQLSDGLIDMVEVLTNPFPDAQREYHRLVDLNSSNKDFNHAAEALRLLSPAVASATYPLQVEEGAMLEDTPLIAAMTRHQRMMLLGEFPHGDAEVLNDTDMDTLFDVTDDLLEAHPALKANLDKSLAAGEPGFHFFDQAYRGLVAATKAFQPQLALAA
jgi:hypothetical protein